ncbi:hypothetical protein BU23DRAFT_626404 [Bimuria novae-zelandiae CBS 107.79]|uniref:Uncharacterized protein n=1 Tax=Bimuria novae-zelandiae CBS 107.79 TaxID=1447943 RepID=A0A6A5VI23_9PLEO|nr:hypothetical protein BU23DRAFT_626404 [Bimuria novae-zelandiae CBS 107.79]
MIDSNISALVDEQQRDIGLSSSLPTSPDGGVPNDSPALLEPSLVPPFPLPASSPLDLPSPFHETQPDLSLGFAGTVLPASNVSLPTSPVVKTSPNLRLPSFDLLGIGAPHPDRIPLRSNYSFSVGSGPLSKPEDPLHVLSPRITQLDGAYDLLSPRPAKAKVEHVVPVVTPPTEEGTFNWGSLVNVRTAALGSPPSSDPAQSPNLATEASAPPLGSVPIVVPTTVEGSGALGMAAWTQSVKEILATESNFQGEKNVKILSHALPCPSTTGHLFAQLIAAIHDQSPANTAWINVFHAVPGRFTLADLPKSPPSTPGPVVGGDEYFTSKIFDSAVAIPDYQLDSKLLPPSPRPVVPPKSIHISIVERYIPPTNTNEYAEMFQLRGHSLLRDRLVELSPDNGLLLFIYPTRTGARTFMQRYLGPILDPLLRSITVVHDLSSELGKNLGQMSSVNYLDEYERLKDQVIRYCEAMSGEATGGNKYTYTVLRATREESILERSAWANDWWIKQEKPRIRKTVNDYFRQVKKLPESGMTASNLIQEVLDGVANRKVEDHREPKGIEVGVFIIKKTNSLKE